ncbi:family 16 glycosylhydrolase [Sediminitomix flava]|uniref:Glycosyl hydrolase family 16 n=1 Tax=Sediminitomix flava TaxID=379075 RepID=A0A315Z617_SEDFL|nr:family 16 glycosylhydrolase [Sediminitomix flava]PWJ39307.1 glycosyl hydrolase family 16 [Sediminitomix flava]
MHKLYILLICVFFSQGCKEAIRPSFNDGEDPKPKHKEWVLVDKLSDEFDGVALDESKWKNTEPKGWIGRPPGIFKKDVVSLDQGSLRLTNYQLSSPEQIREDIFTHAGGYVGSQHPVTVGHYIECRMKANKTFMSSTFWLINNTRDGENCDKRTAELDIQECVGIVTNPQKWAQNKFRQMGSNTHSRNTQCPETPVGSWGNHTDIGGLAFEDFHIYAAWWKSKSEILFFLDGKHVYTVHPEADFDLPMYLRMVTETYNWNPVPEDGGMTGSEEDRTTSYDWVRTWKLEDV